MTQPGSETRPSLKPAVGASLWGYLVLIIAWNLATDPILATYLQLAAPFTIALVGLAVSASLIRIVLLWIAAGGTSLIMVLLIFSGLGLLLVPVFAVYLWTAWKLNKAEQAEYP